MHGAMYHDNAISTWASVTTQFLRQSNINSIEDFSLHDLQVPYT